MTQFKVGDRLRVTKRLVPADVVGFEFDVVSLDEDGWPFSVTQEVSKAHERTWRAGTPDINVGFNPSQCELVSSAGSE